MKNRRPTALPASVHATLSARSPFTHPRRRRPPLQKHIVGATPSNDVEVCDIEGRSAFPRCEGKDHTDSTAIAPEIRLFDASFGSDTFIGMTVHPDAGCCSGMRSQG